MNKERSIEILFPGKLLAKKIKLQARLKRSDIADVWLSEYEGISRVLKVYVLPQKPSTKDWSAWQEQLHKLQQVQHPLIQKVVDWGTAMGMPYLVFPHCKYGSARQWAGKLSESELATFMFQAASALAHLHSMEQPLLHRNLNLDNFLIDKELNYVLTDVTVSGQIRRAFDADFGLMDRRQGYQAPEYFVDKRYTQASDVFALGVCIYEMATGVLPFGDKGGRKLLEGGRIPALPKHFSPRLNQIIQVCLARSPEGRPKASTIKKLANRYLEEASWKSVPGFSFAPPPTPYLHKTTLFSRLRRRPGSKSKAQRKMKPQTSWLVAASITLGIGLAFYIILPFMRATGIEQEFFPREQTQVVSPLQPPSTDPSAEEKEIGEELVSKQDPGANVAVSGVESVDPDKESKEPPILVPGEKNTENKNQSELVFPEKPDAPRLSNKASTSPGPVLPKAVIEEEKVPTTGGMNRSEREAFDRLVRSQAKILSQIQSLQEEQNTLMESDARYLDQIRAEIALLNREMESRVVFDKEDDSRAIDWQRGRRNMVWLQQMQASLNQHQRNLGQIYSRLGKSH